MNIIKEDKKFYEVIKKPISLDEVKEELNRIKREKKDRGFEIYDERIKQLEEKVKIMKKL